MRSREVSVSIILQNLAQLKALFEKQWESIVGNCDEFLYLDVKDLNDKMILEAHEIIDEYDSIYNEDLRDRLRDEQFMEKEEEHEMER